MASKIRKGWKAEMSYRSYSRTFGPMVLIVNYSCPTQKFDARLIVEGKACLHEFIENGEFAGDDDFDNLQLKHFEIQAKAIIREWAS